MRGKFIDFNFYIIKFKGKIINELSIEDKGYLQEENNIKKLEINRLENKECD